MLWWQHICHSAQHATTAIKDLDNLPEPLPPASQAEVGVFSCRAACGWHQKSAKRQGPLRAPPQAPWPCHRFIAACLSPSKDLYFTERFTQQTSMASASSPCSSVNQDIAVALKAAYVTQGAPPPPPALHVNFYLLRDACRFDEKGEFCERLLAWIIWCFCSIITVAQPGCLTVEWSPPNSYWLPGYMQIFTALIGTDESSSARFYKASSFSGHNTFHVIGYYFLTKLANQALLLVCCKFVLILTSHPHWLFPTPSLTSSFVFFFLVKNWNTRNSATNSIENVFNFTTIFPLKHISYSTKATGRTKWWQEDVRYI